MALASDDIDDFFDEQDRQIESLLTQDFSPTGGVVSNDEDFDQESITPGETNPSTTNSVNACLEALNESVGLHIRQPNRAKRAFEESGPLGLFRLFITRKFLVAIRDWTDRSLDEAGKKRVNKMELNAHLGLEMATSLVKLNHIKSHWSVSMFGGHNDFWQTMSRDRFLKIQANSRLHHPETYDHEKSSLDLSWTCRKLLEHLQKILHAAAVPKGACAPDEASI